jgi:xylan 1,4-beta-xylosidase
MSISPKTFLKLPDGSSIHRPFLFPKGMKFLFLGLIFNILPSCNTTFIPYNQSDLGKDEPIARTISDYPAREAKAKKASSGSKKGFELNVIYKDEIEGNKVWGLEQGTGKDFKEVSKNPYKGSTALSLQWDGKKGAGFIGTGFGWNGFKGVDINENYTTLALQFFLRNETGNTPLPRITVIFEDVNGKQIYTRINQFTKDTVLGAVYQKMEAPLRDLRLKEQGLDLKQVKQLMFTFGESGHVYMDEIELITIPETPEIIAFKANPLVKYFGFEKFEIFDGKLRGSWGLGKTEDKNFELVGSPGLNSPAHLSLNWNSAKEATCGLGWDLFKPVDVKALENQSALEITLKWLSDSSRNLQVGLQDGLEKKAFVSLQNLKGQEVKEGWMRYPIPLSQFQFDKATMNPGDLRQVLFLANGDGKVLVDRVRLVALPNITPPQESASNTNVDQSTRNALAEANDLVLLQNEVVVDWSRPVAKITAKHWSMDDYEVINPETAADQEVHKAIQEMKPGIIRIHNAGLNKAWTNETTRSWDIKKIKQCFANMKPGYGETPLLLNLTGWPEWMAAQGEPLPLPQLEDELANLMGDLARILRDEVKQPIAYWELLNELDNIYEKAGKLPDLWRLWNKCAAAVRKADPRAKVGGPALTWAKPEWVKGFMDACGPNADFFTYHMYASPDPKRYTDKELLSQNYNHFAREVLSYKERFPKMEFFLTEFNIQWVWTPFEIRHGNHIGAAWQAQYVKNIALMGIDAAFVWHLKGNAYGLMDGGNVMRATGNLYKWTPQYLTGDLYAGSSQTNGLLEVIPIKTNGGKTLLLINKTEKQVSLPDGELFFGNGKTREMLQINEQGFNPVKIAPLNSQILLPRFSTTLIHQPD